MNLHIRDFNGSDRDYELGVALNNACWPEYKTTVDNAKHFAKTRNPEHYFQKFMLENDTEVIGYGHLSEKWWSTPGEYGMHFCVDPTTPLPFEEAAVVFNHFVLQKLATRQARKLTVPILENRIDQVQFYGAAGYKLVQREPISELEVEAFDFDKFGSAEQKVIDNGFDIVTLPVLKERFADWQQRDYDLVWPIIQDIPSPTEKTQMPFEEFIKEYDSPNFVFESNFYAVERSSQKWVGVSSLEKDSSDAGTMNVGITGVDRAYRGKGIATALKVKTIEFARDHGAKLIRTENDENNRMYDLNMMLGFQPKPALVTYQLVF